MSDWPVGLSTGCFYQTSIFDCLETILRGGFSMLEICSFPKHLDYHDHPAVEEARRMLERLGMEPYSFHAPFADHIDITSLDPGVRGDSKDEIVRAAQAAAHMRARHFVIHPGPEKSVELHPGERLQRMQNAASVLESVAGICEKLNVSIVLENMLPHLVFGNVQDMLWMMGRMRTINVGTCLDTGHAFLSRDIQTVMYKLSGHLRLVHASDSHGHRDDHLPPGDGKVDWDRLLLGLSRTGFRGGFIMEISGTLGSTPEAVLEHARRGRLFLRLASRALDVSTPPTVHGGASV